MTIKDETKEKAQEFGKDAFKVATGGVIAALLAFGLVGPKRYEAIAATENRITRVEERQASLEQRMAQGFTDIKESLNEIKTELRRRP